MAEGIQSHRESKFTDPAETLEVQLKRIEELRDQQHECEADGLPPPALSVDIVMSARAKLTVGKAHGPQDEIVSEMLKLLPITCVYIALHLFSERYLGYSWANVQSLLEIFLLFLQ